MNLKSKFFGVGAAVTLALSMTVGVVLAAPGDDGQANVSAELEDIAACTFTLAVGTGGTLGNWTWNGASGYVVDEGEGAAVLEATLTIPQADDDCDITVTSDGLSADAGTTHPITGGKLTLSSESVGLGSLDSGKVVTIDKGTTSWTGGVTLADPGDVAEGSYSGTIDFEITSGE